MNPTHRTHPSITPRIALDWYQRIVQAISLRKYASNWPQSLLLPLRPHLSLSRSQSRRVTRIRNHKAAKGRKPSPNQIPSPACSSKQITGLCTHPTQPQKRHEVRIIMGAPTVPLLAVQAPYLRGGLPLTSDYHASAVFTPRYTVRHRAAGQGDVRHLVA